MVYTNIKFVWDSLKEIENIKKHHINFDEATSVFTDVNAITSYDFDHSENEDRLKIIGFSNNLNILFVVYVEKNNDIIRIVSARKATKSERKLYEKN